MAGEVAEAAEEIIRETCNELDIEIITNFLEGSINNRKKIEKLLYTYDMPIIVVQFMSSAVALSLVQASYLKYGV